MAGVLGSLGDPISLVEGEEVRGLAGLPAEIADGERGVLGAADVKTLESSRRGVPTVKSSSNKLLLEDCFRRCSKARRLLLAEFRDFLVSEGSGPFP